MNTPAPVRASNSVLRERPRKELFGRNWRRIPKTKNRKLRQGLQSFNQRLNRHLSPKASNSLSAVNKPPQKLIWMRRRHARSSTNSFETLDGKSSKPSLVVGGGEK